MSEKPIRIQRKRTAGWKMPPNTIYVGRPSKWQNPFTVANTGRIPAVVRFACEVAPLLDLNPLRGKNLACWCKLTDECHADVLLEEANSPIAKEVGNALPDWEDLRGVAPDATGDLSSEDFVRKMRDGLEGGNV